MVAWPRIDASRTEAPDPGVLRSWREGTPAFVAVVVVLDSVEVERRRREVLAALHPWCAPSAPGQAHVTLAAVGAVSGVPTGLPLGEVAEVVVRGADSFTSAAFLAVDPGSVAALRGHVLEIVGGDADAPQQWVPHVTAGTYRYPLGAHHVAERLADLRAAAPIQVRGRIRLIAVDRRSRWGRLTVQPTLTCSTTMASAAASKISSDAR